MALGQGPREHASISNEGRWCHAKHRSHRETEAIDSNLEDESQQHLHKNQPTKQISRPEFPQASEAGYVIRWLVASRGDVMAGGAEKAKLIGVPACAELMTVFYYINQ